MRRRLQARTVLSVQEQPRLGSDDAAAACLHARLAEDGFAKCLPSVPGTPRGRARAEDAGAPRPGAGEGRGCRGPPRPVLPPCALPVSLPHASGPTQPLSEARSLSFLLSFLSPCLTPSIYCLRTPMIFNETTSWR